MKIRNRGGCTTMDVVGLRGLCAQLRIGLVRPRTRGQVLCPCPPEVMQACGMAVKKVRCLNLASPIGLNVINVFLAL